MSKRSYLGDGVYVGFDGYQLWLYTSNGVEITNQIALDVQVLAAFLDYVKAGKSTEQLPT